MRGVILGRQLKYLRAFRHLPALGRSLFTKSDAKEGRVMVLYGHYEYRLLDTGD